MDDGRASRRRAAIERRMHKTQMRKFKIVATTSSLRARPTKLTGRSLIGDRLLVFHPIYFPLNSREARSLGFPSSKLTTINAIATAAPLAPQIGWMHFNSVLSSKIQYRNCSRRQSALFHMRCTLHMRITVDCIHSQQLFTFALSSIFNLDTLRMRTHSHSRAIYVFTSAFNGIGLYGHVQLGHCSLSISSGLLFDGATQFVLRLSLPLSRVDFVIKLIYFQSFVCT